ncbi:MAG: DNA-3-methyladenine glycosylase I [Hyphomicrobium sp.]
MSSSIIQRLKQERLMIKNNIRCPWPGIENIEYARYHDEEWGIPQNNSQFLFEKLILEGFQAGLSWLIILKKREAFRAAFDNFDAKTIASYQKKDLLRLMNDKRIVRNQLKIEAVIKNARAYLALAEHTSFARLLWSQLNNEPIINNRRSLKDIPTATPLSLKLSKLLKKSNFHFVGPTTMYAFMQSVGMVNDHLISCPRHEFCAHLQRKFQFSEG